ncbi:hypothetical protein MKW98_002954 [Papaver atlanticum]|uniref:Secreted protein n=1 Tax=Papaver atlanticum TaxID=357466 RepID=A0AAD4THV7_9MAGN|nr:hypothetical protein MKW98_002954 [Papaver atlanticum]
MLLTFPFSSILALQCVTSASKKGRAARKAQAFNHTTCTRSFARKAYERVRQNPPVDPIHMVLLILSSRKLGRPSEDWEINSSFWIYYSKLAVFGASDGARNEMV